MAPVEPAYPNDTATAQFNLADAQAAITTEYLDAYIILPPGFGASLTATGKAPVQVYYDCIDVTKYFLLRRSLKSALPTFKNRIYYLNAPYFIFHHFDQ